VLERRQPALQGGGVAVHRDEQLPAAVHREEAGVRQPFGERTRQARDPQIGAHGREVDAEFPRDVGDREAEALAHGREPLCALKGADVAPAFVLVVLRA
jgi:hypothetical protein